MGERCGPRRARPRVILESGERLDDSLRLEGAPDPCDSIIGGYILTEFTAADCSFLAAWPAMTRRRDQLYTAVGRATLAQVAAAGGAYAIVPKLDGCFCLDTTDARGLLRRLESRAGKAFPAAIAPSSAASAGRPTASSRELEWTEAAHRIADARGYRVLHFFDALRVSGEDVTRCRLAAGRGMRCSAPRAHSSTRTSDRTWTCSVPPAKWMSPDRSGWGDGISKGAASVTWRGCVFTVSAVGRQLGVSARSSSLSTRAGLSASVLHKCLVALLDGRKVG